MVRLARDRRPPGSRSPTGVVAGPEHGGLRLVGRFGSSCRAPHRLHLVEVLRVARRSSRAGGGPGRNCDGDVIAQGVMFANCRNEQAGRTSAVSAASPRRWCPSTYGGGRRLMPSPARQARISSATCLPQARPRWTDWSFGPPPMLCERGGQLRVEGRLLSGEQVHERLVGGLDHGSLPGRSGRRRGLHVDRRVLALDAVQRVEDRRLHDRPDPHRRRRRGLGGLERVDHRPVPDGDEIRLGIRFGNRRCCKCGERRDSCAQVRRMESASFRFIDSSPGS